MLEGRKGISWLMILTLMIIIVVPASGSSIYNQLEKEITDELTNGKTLYVGGSGSNNYTKIQDAIDDASDGDTVYVYEGLYVGFIEINCSINLIGEDKNSTIIDGNDTFLKSTIKINNDNVSVSCFTIQNGSTNGIKINTSNNKIFNNIITRNNYGINLYSDFKIIKNNLIINNQIINQSSGGIQINSWVIKTRVINNIIQDSYHGIEITSDYHIISNNIIQNIEQSGIGLWTGANRNTITNNTIKKCWGGILVSLSYYNQIFNNLLENNYYFGIWLINSCEYNNISYNIIQKNLCGIWLNDCTNNNITRNNFQNNIRQASFVWRKNNWNENYWNKPSTSPKIIIGRRRLLYFAFLPAIDIDWNPAKEPYDI